MLLSGVFVDRSPWELGIATTNMLCLPDEVLKNVSLVLGQQKDFGLFDDIAKVCYKGSTFR